MGRMSTVEQNMMVGCRQNVFTVVFFVTLYIYLAFVFFYPIPIFPKSPHQANPKYLATLIQTSNTTYQISGYIKKPMKGKQVMCGSNTEKEEEAISGILQGKNESSQDEDDIIFQMRALVEKHDPTSKKCDNPTMRRFLRARGMDIKEACDMFLKYRKWRKTFLPNGFISDTEIPNELAQNKMFMQGSDKKGCPISIVFGGRHYHNKTGGIEEFKRFVVFGLEKICSRIPHGQEKFVSINDLQGWGYSNFDRQGYHAALLTLQDYYPERLGKLYIVHAPYIFMAIWKILYPFIDEETKRKIVFVENKKLKSTLLQDIEESQLPEIYGGKLKLVPIQDS